MGSMLTQALLGRGNGLAETPEGRPAWHEIWERVLLAGHGVEGGREVSKVKEKRVRWNQTNRSNVNGVTDHKYDHTKVVGFNQTGNRQLELQLLSRKLVFRLRCAT